MNITKGLFDHCVIQRNHNDVCETRIEGLMNTGHIPQFKVLGPAGSVSCQLNNVIINESYNAGYQYSFQATLCGIPTGGPYNLLITSGSSLVEICDVLVGDVYLLGGQSNMQGIGRMSGKHPSHLYVRAFYMDDHWGIAEDPLHKLSLAKEPIHSLIAGGRPEPESDTIGVGPGVAFANSLYQMTGAPQGVIACADGGTSMSQWSPTNNDNGIHSLYQAMLRRFQQNGCHVKGLLWYQGCNDANADEAPYYLDKTKEFIASLRRDTGLLNLPVVMVQISRVCYPFDDSRFWNSVQQQQYQIGQEIEVCETVPTIDLEMDDFIHISGNSQTTLGKRCAKAMYHLTVKDNTELPQISLDKVEVVRQADVWNCQINITYKNVCGGLIASGRPTGFSISKDPNDQIGSYIYHTELRGNQVILYTSEVEIDVKNMYLHYGNGFMPYCNITDMDNRSLPVISAIPLGEQRLFSEPCKKAFITEPTYGETFEQINKYTPNEQPAVYRDFYYFYLNTYNKFRFTEKNSFGKITYYIPIESKAEQSGYILFGSGNALKIYNERQLVASVPFSDDLVSPDMYQMPIKLNKGTNLLNIDLFANSHSKAGVFIRFEGIDIEYRKELPWG